MTKTGPEESSVSRPLVSIIIPCYNGREFVSEAIESALAQTYPNVEVVVIDDGSTDGSPETIQRYPVLFVQGTHGGVSAARNLGIEASHGEYLVFLDSDDRLLPHAIESGLKLLQRHPACAMAVGAHNIAAHNGERIVMRCKPCQLENGYEMLLRSNFIECTSSVVFRRSFLGDGLAFRPSLSGAEDYELYLRLAREAPFCCHNEVVTEYRLHSSSASRKSAMMLSHTLTVFSEQWPYAKGSLRYLRSFLYGSYFWRRKYGRQLTVEMATSETPISAQERQQAWRLLARSYPFGIIVLLVSRILPRNLVRSVLHRA